MFSIKVATMVIDFNETQADHVRGSVWWHSVRLCLGNYPPYASTRRIPADLPLGGI